MRAPTTWAVTSTYSSSERTANGGERFNGYQQPVNHQKEKEKEMTRRWTDSRSTIPGGRICKTLNGELGKQQAQHMHEKSLSSMQMDEVGWEWLEKKIQRQLGVLDAENSCMAFWKRTWWLGSGLIQDIVALVLAGVVYFGVALIKPRVMIDDGGLQQAGAPFLNRARYCSRALKGFVGYYADEQLAKKKLVLW